MKSKINILIAIYEMIGGIWGISMMIIHFHTKVGDYKALSLLISLFMLTLYVLLLIGGFLLWRGKEKGVVISIIVQIFQIPYIITASCMYFLVSGLQLVAGIIISSNMIEVLGMWHLGFYFRMYFGNAVEYSAIGINIIPIIIILHIRRVQKIANSKQLEDKNQVVNVTNDLLKSVEE